MPPDTNVREDDDPYASRSSAEYYSDSASIFSASSASSSTNSSSSQPSATSTSPSSQHRQSSETSRANAEERSTDPTAEDELEGQRVEEPLFGTQGRSDRGGSGCGNNAIPPALNNEEEEDERDSYYALLNVQRDANDEEIREAYRSLAIVLHPDKHTAPELKASAENRFRAVQKAYEVLSDHEKRSIYDHFGTQGLNQSWSLVRRSTAGGPRTAAELREEWEKVARKKKADEVENLIRSKGEFTANLDASSLFCAPERVPRSKQVLQQLGRELALREKEKGSPLEMDEEIEIELPPVAFSERWNRLGVTSLTGKHGWEMPLTGYSRLLFSGQMVSRGGMGGGNLIGSLRTQWTPKLALEASTTLMRPRVATVKATYGVNEFSWLTFIASSSNFAVPPQLNLTFAQRLSHKSSLTGFTSLKSGSYTLGPWGANVGNKMKQETPSVAVGLTASAGKGKGWTMQTSLGLDNQSITADYAFRPAFLGSPKQSVGLTLGTRSGFNAFHSIERKVTENIKVGLGVNVGIPMGGVGFQVRFNRLGQKVNIPIQLSPEYRGDLTAAFTVLPLASMMVLEHLYLKPLKRRKISSKLGELRKQNHGLIRERKLAALEARSVLREAARKKADLERRRDSLVVLQAYYGKRDSWPSMPSVDSFTPEELYEQAWQSQDAADANIDEVSPGENEVNDDDESMWWDVRIPVMILVNKGQLIIPGGRHKSRILGFFDPCMGERKHLVVRYLFRNRLHEVVVDDVTQLAAPLRAHQL